MPPMELKTMPLETAAEVLQFIAEREEFESLVAAMSEDLSRKDVRNMLIELAVELRKIAALKGFAYDPQGDKNLTSKTRKTLNCLSPMETKTLLSAFGLIERK